MTVSLSAPENNPVEVEGYQFPGFSAPSYTMVPNVLFDELGPHLSGAELRVMLYITRRTFGFEKLADRISFGQFLDGITTYEGRVLDIGCGVKSRGHLSKALKNLVRIGVIVTVKSQKPNGSNAVSTYALRIPEGGFPETNYPGSQIELGVVPEANLQETVLQHKEKEGEILSKDTSYTQVVDNSGDNSGDNSETLPGTVPQIAVILSDFSKEMNDYDHTASNITQATRLYGQAGCSLDTYFTILYAARTTTRKATGVRNRMAYFFEALRRQVHARVKSAYRAAPSQVTRTGPRYLDTPVARSHATPGVPSAPIRGSGSRTVPEPPRHR